MIDNFTSILMELPVMREFKRIKKNEENSSINIPYTIEYIDMLIEHFEKQELYEYCDVIIKYKSKRITHDEKFKP